MDGGVCQARALKNHPHYIDSYGWQKPYFTSMVNNHPKSLYAQKAMRDRHLNPRKNGCPTNASPS